jgi:type IV fimbrial biogenesis protein FimT
VNAKGVTLVELIVVLAILSILLAIVLPSYAYFSASNRIAAFTNDLVGAFQLARSEAIRRATLVTVCASRTSMDTTPTCDASASWQEGWVLFQDGGVTGNLDGDDLIIRVGSGQAVQGELSADTNFNDYLSYKSTGVSQGSTGLGNGTISLCISGHGRIIIISNTGRIRLKTEDC